MRILDTMVLIASLDSEHAFHKRAMHHLRLASSENVYVPSAAVLEMDLELKSHGFSSEERRGARSHRPRQLGPGKNLPLRIELYAETTTPGNVSAYLHGLTH